LQDDKEEEVDLAKLMYPIIQIDGCLDYDLRQNGEEGMVLGGEKGILNHPHPPRDSSLSLRMTSS
jgi:hypothetical protein